MPPASSTPHLSDEKTMRLTRPRFWQRLKPKQIGQQIGYGYLVAIAVGWLGSAVGMVVADYFQGQGIWQLLDAQAQARLLFEYKDTATQARLQIAHSMSLREDAAQWQQERQTLAQSISSLSALRQELNTLLTDDPRWLAADPATLESLLTEYEQVLQQQADQLAAYPLNGEAMPPTLVSSIARNREKNDQLQAELLTIIQTALDQEALAADVLEGAQGLEKLIIIMSITLAGLMSGLIAWRVTRAIAVPLEDITITARQVARKDDYTLRTTVLTDDEVGTLAQSLNELIERVGERTTALQQAAQTAAQQNQELEAALQDLRTAQRQLVQTEKMSSLGQLAAGIAHEVNNPIGFIQGNLRHLKEYSDTLFETIDTLRTQLPESAITSTDPDELSDLDFIRQDLPKIIESIKHGAERVNSLTLSLKVFSRLQESQIKPANLNDGLDSCLSLLGHRLKLQAKRPEIVVIRRYGDLPSIRCYSSQMNQVFMNILTNAIDAIDERWAQTSATWQPEIKLCSDVTPESLIIEIQNNGLPIPQSIQDKIFDPFFTTKTVGQGVGLGLSISYEMVCKKHHGDIQVMSPIADEMGTKFVLQIPRSGVSEE